MSHLTLTNTLSIKALIEDGFRHIADVSRTSTSKLWRYENINQDACRPHDSWVYVVCVSDRIVKLGETNLRLFIPKIYDPTVPTTNGGRLGRLSRGAETDKNIRIALHSHTQRGEVSIYARSCPIHKVKRTVVGEERDIPLKGNQQEEKDFLDKIKQITGHFPPLNKARK